MVFNKKMFIKKNAPHGGATQRLTNEQWSEMYDEERYHKVVSSVRSGKVSVWSKEILKICQTYRNKELKVLEIGCGGGESICWLAKHGIDVTGVDYSKESIELIDRAASVLGVNVNTYVCDATEEMPFQEKQFDIIFQAGLLEHFYHNEQIELLTRWSKYGKHMVSMIPNASSLPYRLGKERLERTGKWEFGLEMPKHSLAQEFEYAGIKVDNEYSIGSRAALAFLPKYHVLRLVLFMYYLKGIDLEKYMQGYLLVTVGKCER